MRNSSRIINWLIAILILLASAGGIIITAHNGQLPDLECRQNQTDLYLPLDKLSPITQSIQPTVDRFASLTIYPQAAPDSPHSITISLYDTNDATIPLAVIQRPLSAVRNGKLHIRFKALPAGQAYWLRISTDAPPEILFLAASSEDRYQPGDLLTTDGKSLPHDLSFNTYYSPTLGRWMKLFDHAELISLKWLIWTCALSLAGFLFYFATRPKLAPRISFFILFLRSTGLGIGITILLGYTQSLLNIPITTTSLIIWGILLLATAACRWLFDHQNGLPAWQIAAPVWEDGAPFAILLFTLTSRAIQTAGLEPVPLWVDGFNHYNKLALLAREGILPLHINYPFGYHLMSYVNHLISGLNLSAAAFDTGFWISALIIPAAWPLARRIFKNPWSATLAVILYGFFAPFPAYLATWSRFPFLLGLTLLPLALDTALDWLEQPARSFPVECLQALSAALLAAGLVLSHYGTIVHYAAFLVAILITWHIWPQKEGDLRLQILRLSGMVLPVLLILMVKVGSLMQQSFWTSVLEANQAADQAIDLRYALSQTTMHGGWFLWGLAIAGLVTTIFWKEHRKTTFLATSWLLTLCLLNLAQISLLGTAVSSWMNYIIALSLPLSWLASSALSGAATALKSFLPKDRYPSWLPATLLGCMLLAGFTGISGIINPVTILFTSQDRQAMEWILDNIPQDAIFYIDSFQWGSSITPSNGGGWLPALTNRSAVHPYIHEQRENLQDFLVQRGVNYVYTHSTQALADIPLFSNAHPVFQNEALVIYQINSP